MARRRLAVFIAALLLLAPVGSRTLKAQGPIPEALWPAGFPDMTPFVDPGTGEEFPQSGKFINVTRGLASLGDVGAGQKVFNVSLAVPDSLSAFELEIFDGDMGGKWDRLPSAGAPDQLTFKLYADPNLQGADGSQPGDVQLYTWPADGMPDDLWCRLNPAYNSTDPSGVVCNPTALIPQSTDAYNASKAVYYYHLVAWWSTTQSNHEQNVFKVRVRGQPFLLAGSTIGFEGFSCQVGTAGCQAGDWLYDTYYSPGYDGIFEFNFVLPGPADVIELYDGDFDLNGDTDDGNSPNCKPGTLGCEFPPFQTSPDTKAEGVNVGNPADDNAYGPIVWSPEVYYEVQSPGYPADGSFKVTNNNVSGNQEWEVFTFGPGGDAEVPVPVLPEGAYRWRIFGADALNTLFVHVEYQLFPTLPKLGNTVWKDLDGDGYWDGPLSEPGISGVKLNLYKDVNQNGELDAGDIYQRSTTTNGDGQYWFYDIPIDVSYTYWLVEVDAQNFAEGQPLHGLLQTVDRSTETGDHYNRHVPWGVKMPPANVDYIKADFGFVPPGGDFCFWDPKDPDNGATGDWWLTNYTVDGESHDAVTIRIALNRSFADNAYGPNSVATGWAGGGRRFKQIWTSDCLEMTLFNGTGEGVMQFAIDLLSPVDSGYETLGFAGGDGYWKSGDSAHVLDYDTSISWNLNHTGWDDFANSPPVDADYNCLDESCPGGWIWDTWYQVTIDLDAFGDSGFGGLDIPYLHSSPSKTSSETPGQDPCPPDWNSQAVTTPRGKKK